MSEDCDGVNSCLPLDTQRLRAESACVCVFAAESESKECQGSVGECPRRRGKDSQQELLTLWLSPRSLLHPNSKKPACT